MAIKRKTDKSEHIIAALLDAQDSETLIIDDKSCRTLFANAAAERRFAANADITLHDLYKDGYARLLAGLYERCAAIKEELGTSIVFEEETKDERLFSVKATRVEWINGKHAIMLSLSDITEERNASRQLYRLAYLDALTDIPNRLKLRADFDRLAADIAAQRVRGAIALFDLDHFKEINDTYGHNTGDMILRRLVEYLTDDEVFRDRLYRLGGDEFVIFFHEPINEALEPDGGEGYYDFKLERAFRSYTIPTIELSCTLSMGVALFPKDGLNYSDLLRKADIALYKAKAAGRNRKIFFEEKFDTAKKFRDLYVNIQPILVHSGGVFGYELIDEGTVSAEDVQDDETLSLSEADRTMEVIGLSDLANNARYFISFTNQLASETVRNNLPRDKFVVQLPAYNAHSSSMMAKYLELKQYGYSLAAVGVKSSNATAELLDLVDYIKFDSGVNSHFQQRLIAENPNKIFIATEVDTAPQLDMARRRGFKLFQGFFFSVRTVTKKTKEIDPLHANYVRLLKLTSSGEYVDFHEISRVISSDVGLTYKLLRLLNSAAVGLRNVSSINMGVAYLGEENLKKWVALLAMRGIVSNRPLELVRISIIRAQFGENLAPYFKQRRDPKQVFLVGLLSLLHVALDKTKEEMLNELPVTDEIRESLISSKGRYSDLINFFKDYEYGNWAEVSKFREEHGLSNDQINECYMNAVKWYKDLSGNL